MSDEDNDLFARWSRRKRAARSNKARNTDEEAQVADAPAAEAGADPQLPATAPAAGEPPEPIPSLEDLTADGDLSAFLREGVPTALKNAAMRKMWSLDSAIRDHVGLAEYAWDFNQPGSMAGFGPLEASKSVASFLSTTSGAGPADSEGAGTVSETPMSPPPKRHVTAAASKRAASPQPAESVQRPDMPEDPERSENRAAATGDSAEETDPAQTLRAATAPRHGGALPR